MLQVLQLPFATSAQHGVFEKKQKLRYHGIREISETPVCSGQGWDFVEICQATVRLLASPCPPLLAPAPPKS